MAVTSRARGRSNGRKPRRLTKRDLSAAFRHVPDGDDGRLMHLDLVGTAEAAEEILHVERARIGKWRRKGILLSDGTRIKFPEPIQVVTTVAKIQSGPRKGEPDHSKLAASPLWWGDDIRALAKTLAKNKPRD